MALGKKKAPTAEPDTEVEVAADAGDEAEQGKKGKKAKKSKKAKKEKPVKLDKKGRPVKGKKISSLLKIIIPVVLVLLIAAFVFEEYKLDYFKLGYRQKFVDLVNKLDPDYDAIEEFNSKLSEREGSVVKREEAAVSKDAELKAKEKALNDRETALNTFEAELKQRDQGGIPIFRKPMTEAEEADMNKLAAWYKAMTPEEAAERLVELKTTEEITAILYYMSEKNAAPILQQFEVRLAAEITELILQRRNAVG